MDEACDVPRCLRMEKGWRRPFDRITGIKRKTKDGDAERNVELYNESISNGHYSLF